MAWWPFGKRADDPAPAVTLAAAEDIAARFFTGFFRSDVPRRAVLTRDGSGRPVWAFHRTMPDGTPYTNRGGNIRLLIDASHGAVTGFWLERR